MEKENRFGEYIAKLRVEKNVSQMELCDGLCSVSMLSRFERGEREPDKLLQNRFLTRLGVVPENYENFLFHKDYLRWERRQGILHNILEENMENALDLLEDYRWTYDMEKALEKQFYLAMLAQIRRYEGVEDSELAELFEMALELTVPNIEEYGFMNRVLSLEEINLLLEYVYCSGLGKELFWYEEIIQYIVRMDSTPLAKAKIYPKVVYYYYLTGDKMRIFLEKKKVTRLLELCDNAIEALRNTNRMFYLWELLCIKEKLLQKHYIEESEERLSEFEKCVSWKNVLQEICEEYGIPIRMYEFCYLYVESENYCIGEVIRVRRKMLGLSMKKLSRGICSERTISRLERSKTEPQKEIVKMLFDRLNLSTELCRTELITESEEAIKKYRKLRKLNNSQEFSKMVILIEELKKLIDIEIPSNKQILMRKEIICQYNLGLLSKQEYVLKMKEALECTLPYKVAIDSGKKYFTNEEIDCLQNITLELDWSFKEVEEYVNVMIEFWDRVAFPESYIRMYQFTMASVASYLGTKGDYEASNQIEKRIIKLLLKNRRLGGIHEALYELLWNFEKVNKNNVDKEKLSIELNRCIKFSEIVKHMGRKAIYEKKLEEL